MKGSRSLLAVALSGVTSACHFVAGLDDFGVADGGPVSLVGNGVLDDGEACDDDNADDGDGCSAKGQFEPGWRCDTVGEPCARVSGFEAEERGTLELGGSGGGDFAESCEEAGIIVGLEGFSNGQLLGEVRALCARVRIDGEGRLAWTAEDVTPTAPHGTATDELLAARTCPEGQVVVGLSGSTDNQVAGIALRCATVQFRVGAFEIDDEVALDVFGASDGEPVALQSCGLAEVARAFVGKSGSLIDRGGFRCDRLTPTFCGDALLDAPFEACDGGAGCTDRCELE